VHAEVADALLTAVVDLLDEHNPFDTDTASCECGEWTDQPEGDAVPCVHMRAVRAVELAKSPKEV